MKEFEIEIPRNSKHKKIQREIYKRMFMQTVEKLQQEHNTPMLQKCKIALDKYKEKMKQIKQKVSRMRDQVNAIKEIVSPELLIQDQEEEKTLICENKACKMLFKGEVFFLVNKKDEELKQYITNLVQVRQSFNHIKNAQDLEKCQKLRDQIALPEEYQKFGKNINFLEDNSYELDPEEYNKEPENLNIVLRICRDVKQQLDLKSFNQFNAIIIILVLATIFNVIYVIKLYDSNINQFKALQILYL